ncbi:hypothetical protein BN12_790028 [Nostocoides japonicum T1-X7]|uniref:Uncharacterized protein n=1 Tax=Nostocoides japonicum T1-X7 TaxID=1194083 RepID=A0A077M804_9MICO|nr:hypothetical protein BN12_790028 [Tetrasphaera japonica T1-X7]
MGDSLSLGQILAKRKSQWGLLGSGSRLGADPPWCRCDWRVVRRTWGPWLRVGFDQAALLEPRTHVLNQGPHVLTYRATVDVPLLTISRDEVRARLAADRAARPR